MKNEPISKKTVAIRAMALLLVGGMALAGTALVGTVLGADAPIGDATAKPQAAKPDRNGIKAAQAAVQSAIVALQKEVQAHVKDPKIALREKCNYFTENPSPNLLPEAIVQALGSKVSSDPVADSYVKWQLLSGVSGKFDEQLALLAASAYDKAAKPPARPGLLAEEKRQLDAYTKNVHSADDSLVLTKKLAELTEAWEARVKPITAYRDELYAKLPPSPEALVARVDDLKDRTEAGIDGEVMLKATMADIDQWVAKDPPATHLYVMVERVKRLTGDKGGGGKAVPGAAGRGMNKYGNYAGGAMQQFPPKYFEHVEFVDEKPKPAYWKWADVTTKLARGDTLKDFIVTLEDSAKNSTNKGVAGDMTKGAMKK